uniref:CUT domain-containing protein n=1 Tax=Parastrongyloides trichosuri TaxID=131310 RepID=A0A0N4ZGP0_PARTI
MSQEINKLPHPKKNVEPECLNSKEEENYEFGNKSEMFLNSGPAKPENIVFFEEINTKELSKDVLNFLKIKNIPISVFARNMIRLPYHNVYYVLNKPGTWSKLKNENRQIFIKLKAYLDSYVPGMEKPTIFEDSNTSISVHDHTPNLVNKEETIYEKEACSNLKGFAVKKKTSTNVLSVTELLEDCSKQCESSMATFSIRDEIDTSVLARRIIKKLEELKIGQDLFARKYLQSEPQDFLVIINYPRSWISTTTYERELYTKIYCFLESLKFMENIDNTNNGLANVQMESRNLNNNVENVNRSGASNEVPNKWKLARSCFIILKEKSKQIENNKKPRLINEDNDEAMKGINIEVSKKELLHLSWVYNSNPNPEQIK